VTEGDGKKYPVIEGPREIVERIIKALKEVYDPEIPVNIWDLGLVYELKVKEKEGGKYDVDILMTLTALGCPVAASLAAYVEEAIKDAVPEVDRVNVEVTFDPPWSPEMVTEEGRELLKAIYGYDVVEEWKRRMQEQF